MEVTNQAELRALVGRLAAAHSAGGEAEALIESMLGLDDLPTEGSGGAFDRLRIMDSARRRKAIGISADQVYKAKAALAEFAAALARLPERVSLPHVGTVEVAGGMRSRSEGWSDRMATTGNHAADRSRVGELKNEVSAIMADLERLRLRVGLAKMRME